MVASVRMSLLGRGAERGRADSTRVDASESMVSTASKTLTVVETGDCDWEYWWIASMMVVGQRRSCFAAGGSLG